LFVSTKDVEINSTFMIVLSDTATSLDFTWLLYYSLTNAMPLSSTT
jgi:hypothetical protein